MTLLAYLNPLLGQLVEIARCFQVEPSKEEQHDSTDDSANKIVVTSYPDVINEAKKLIAEFLGVSKQPNLFGSLRYTDAQILIRVCRNLLEKRPQDYFLLFCIFVLDTCADYWNFLNNFKTIYQTFSKTNLSDGFVLDLDTKRILSETQFIFRRVPKQDLERALDWFKNGIKLDLKHDACQKFVQVSPNISFPSFKALSILTDEQAQLARSVIASTIEFAHSNKVFIIQTRLIRFLDFTKYFKDILNEFVCVSLQKRSTSVKSYAESHQNTDSLILPVRSVVDQHADLSPAPQLFCVDFASAKPMPHDPPSDNQRMSTFKVEPATSSSKVPGTSFVPSSRISPNPKTMRTTNTLQKSKGSAGIGSPTKQTNSVSQGTRPATDKQSSATENMCTVSATPGQPVCCFCDLPVRGLFRLCSKCKHGGHLEHFNSWFGAINQRCPKCHTCNCAEHFTK